jgi:hypothetical protein
VVIIAAFSTHSDFGLHSVRLEQKSQDRTHFDNLELVFRPYDYVDCLATSKWSTCGWFLQEGLIAQQKSILTDREIFLEYRHGLYHESQENYDMFMESGNGILEEDEC